MTRFTVDDEIIRLDTLTRALLGREDAGRLEALLAANPGLAARGLFAVAGETLDVPAITAAPALLPSVNPWE